MGRKRLQEKSVKYLRVVIDKRADIESYLKEKINKDKEVFNSVKTNFLNKKDIKKSSEVFINVMTSIFFN